MTHWVSDFLKNFHGVCGAYVAVTTGRSALPPPPCSSAPLHPVGQHHAAPVNPVERLPNGADNPVGQGFRGSTQWANGQTQWVRGHDPVGQGIPQSHDPVGESGSVLPLFYNTAPKNPFPRTRGIYSLRFLNSLLIRESLNQIPLASRQVVTTM